MSTENEQKKSTKPSKKALKIKIVIFALITLVFAGGVYFALDFLQQNNSKEKALKACELVYNKKVNTFTEQTGISQGNVVFNKPEFTHKRNLWILNFNNISLGTQTDKFVCYYNVSLNKATDRTPEFDPNAQ